MCQINIQPGTVINGCVAKCCECFTLPVTPNDLQKMKDRWVEDPENIKDDKIMMENGYERYPLPINELDNLMDMLIYLRITPIDPATGISINESSSSSINSDGTINHNTSHGHFTMIDGVLNANTYTCRHFDKDKRICSNYENRPQLCRNYGRGCQYQGCNFDKVRDGAIINVEVNLKDNEIE